MDDVGGATFLGLNRLFPGIRSTSCIGGRDPVMELNWVGDRPEVTPLSRCSDAAPQQNPGPRPVSMSTPVVGVRSVDEEAAVMDGAPCAWKPSTPVSPLVAPPLPPSGRGRVGLKRPREELREVVGAGASVAVAGQAASSPTAMMWGTASSYLSRVEHVSYDTTVMSYDDLSEDLYYSGGTTLSSRFDSEAAVDKDDSERSGSVHYKQKRRQKFNQNLQQLEEIIPNTSKNDTISILDRAIDHLKQLQSFAQMARATEGGTHQAITQQEYLTRMILTAQLMHSNGCGNGMEFNHQLHAPMPASNINNIYNWPSLMYPLGYTLWGYNVHM